ncbi:MAG: hypothetical protein ACR2FY_14395 [Pirellulaceae bacterium]
MAAKFLPAYIELKADLGEWDQGAFSEDIPFVHNLGEADVGNRKAHLVRNVSNDKWFWSIQTIASYEPDAGRDFDADKTPWLAGYAFNNQTDANGKGAYIYLFTEVLRDINAYPGDPPPYPPGFKEITLDDAVLVQRSLLHEIGHEMGGFHHSGATADQSTVKDEGPMDTNNLLYGNDMDLQFTPRQLGRIQSAILVGAYGSQPLNLPGDP